MGADSSIPAQLGVISSGVYDEQKKSFFMIDNDGKIWEYNLTTEQWTSRSLWIRMKIITCSCWMDRSIF